MEKQEIIINKIAQGKISIENGIKWFDSLSDVKKKVLFFTTKFYTIQSHPNENIIKTIKPKNV